MLWQAESRGSMVNEVTMQRRKVAAWAWMTAKMELEEEGKDPKGRALCIRAARLFKKKWQGTAPHHIGCFVRQWGEHWEKHPSGSLADRPGKGRWSKLTPEAADRAAEILEEGYEGEAEEQEGYTNVQDAYERSPELAAICHAAKVKPATLWKRLRKSHGLRFVHSPAKRVLTPEQRRERLRVVQLLLSMPRDKLMDYLLRTFWIDSKKYRVVAGPRKEIGRRGRPVRVRSHVRGGMLNAKDRQVINYYAVVNALVGPVLFVEVTGTTGLGWAKPYKVSRGAYDGVYSTDLSWHSAMAFAMNMGNKRSSL
jgi:hypothetical protein